MFTLIAVFAAAAVTAFGAYTVAEIVSLNSRTRSISSATAQLIDVQQDLGDQELDLAGHIHRTIDMADDLSLSVQNIAYQQQAEHTISTLEKKIATIREIVSSAMHQRLAPAAMQQQQYKKFISVLQQETVNRGFQLLISRVADLLQCSTSFVISDSGFSIITHIPSSPVEAILDMYRFIPLPIPVHSQYHALVDISDTVLAIAPSEVIFRTLSAFDLSQCDKLGEYFICQNGNVMRKALPALSETSKDQGVCMYAIFTQNFKIIPVVCDIFITPASTTVLQLSPRSFATYSARDFSGTLQCTGAALNISSVHFHAHKIKTLSLEPGCILDSEQHVFSAGDRARTRAWSVNITLPLAELRLTADLNFTSFHQFRQHADFTFRNTSKFHLPTALVQWKAWQHASSQTPSPLDSFLAPHPWLPCLVFGLCLSQLLLFFYVRRLLSRIPSDGPSQAPGPQISVMTVNHAADLPYPPAPPYAPPSAPSAAELSRNLFPSLKK